MRGNRILAVYVGRLQSVARTALRQASALHTGTARLRLRIELQAIIQIYRLWSSVLLHRAVFYADVSEDILSLYSERK
jgi:hypothetical protein